MAGILTAGQAQKYLNMDGYLVGKKVFILGSGDIGLIMARRMEKCKESWDYSSLKRRKQGIGSLCSKSKSGNVQIFSG